MLSHFQLVAITIKGKNIELYKVPLMRQLQETLAMQWQAQLDDFVSDVELIPFNAGYTPEPEQRFAIDNFELPEWLVSHTNQSVPELPSIGSNDERLSDIKALAGFGRLEDGREVVLFQNFSRSHVIRPGRALLLAEGIYNTNSRPTLTLGIHCNAVFYVQERRLVFSHFRSVNVYLPLAEYYEEAAEEDIRDILGHDSFSPENIDALAKDASQWFRKRFAILRDSNVMNDYSVQHIVAHSQGYDIELEVVDEKIVFPEDKTKAKKLLQFLNEELYKGAITDKLYETNSKREAE